MKKGGKRPWGCCFALHPRHVHYLNTTMLCKGKKKLMVATAARDFDLAFQNCWVKFTQHFSGSYALVQVFCFCSTNFTWFNSIIKYKNLTVAHSQTNKFGLTRHFLCIYLTKLFIVKKMATFIQPSNTYWNWNTLRESQPSYKLFLAIAYLTWLSPVDKKSGYANLTLDSLCQR